MVVSRASQVHQMPQARRPQIGPVMSTTVQKTTPTSAPASAQASAACAHSGWLRRKARKPIDPASEMAKKRKATIAEGTW